MFKVVLFYPFLSLENLHELWQNNAEVDENSTSFILHMSKENFT